METNPGPQHSVPAVYRILCRNVWVLARNLSDLTVVSSQYDILLCFETLVSDMHHMSQLLVQRFSALSCYAGARCIVPEGWLHSYEIRANLNLSVVVAKFWFLRCVV